MKSLKKSQEPINIQKFANKSQILNLVIPKFDHQSLENVSNSQILIINLPGVKSLKTT